MTHKKGLMCHLWIYSFCFYTDATFTALLLPFPPLVLSSQPLQQKEEPIQKEEPKSFWVESNALALSPDPHPQSPITSPEVTLLSQWVYLLLCTYLQDFSSRLLLLEAEADEYCSVFIYISTIWTR